ncbi:MAG: galactokinase [Gemmatimonadetes bacterium]|nr:galactokinase [Gemmatimonadota bacterium]
MSDAATVHTADGARWTLDQRVHIADAPWSEAARASYVELMREAHARLDEQQVPRDGRRTWVVPGRIEVLGKHVDYAGGRSLLCTVERGVVFVARPRHDRTVVLRDVRRREVYRLFLDGGDKGHVSWAVYPRTVMRRLDRNFPGRLRGMEIAIASNLPSAAGVSSSSALTVGLTLVARACSALDAAPGWQQELPDRVRLAGYVGALENGANFGTLTGERGVGTMGGAQDQTAILCSAPSQLDVFAWAPVTHEGHAPWPASHVFVVGVSGVVAAKSGGARERYNRASRTAQHLVAAWNATGAAPTRTLREAVCAAAGAPNPTAVPGALIDAARASATAEFTAAHLEARLEQFVAESFTLVPGAAEALRQADLRAFGTLVDTSQAGAERALENQIPETVNLQRLARDLGADAASAFGAGFGGSVWAMISARNADAFAARWLERYRRHAGRSASRAQVFVTRPSLPAVELLDEG